MQQRLGHQSIRITVDVLQIENGDVGHTEVGTLRAYVEALGGRLRVVAEIGETSVTINDWTLCSNLRDSRRPVPAHSAAIPRSGAD